MKKVAATTNDRGSLVAFVIEVKGKEKSRLKEIIVRGSNMFYFMFPSMPKGEIDGNIEFALMSI